MNHSRRRNVRYFRTTRPMPGRRGHPHIPKMSPVTGCGLYSGLAQQKPVGIGGQIPNGVDLVFGSCDGSVEAVLVRCSSLNSSK